MRYEQQIRRTFDVVSTHGPELLCRCPWHGDGGKPNLYVNGNSGLFLCQSCGRKGHMQNITGMLPSVQAQDLRDRLAVIKNPATYKPRIYTETWLKRFAHQHPAWADRGLSQEVIDKFDLGYDPMTDVLTIPIRTMTGKVMGVITRRLDDQKPKYLYPKGFPIGKYLWGAWAVPPDQHKVALVEGTIDAIACWDARVPALAMLGARLTNDQRGVLQQLGIQTVVIFTDNDNPGREAVPQIRSTLAGSGIAVKVAIYRPYWAAKDPAELTEQRRRKAYHSAVPWHRWMEMSSQAE